MEMFISILTFFFIYNVPFTGFPVSSSKIVVLILFLIDVFECKGKIKINNVEITTFLFAFALLLVSTLAMIINGTSDTSIIYSSFLLIVNNMLGAFLLVKVLQNKNLLTLNYVMKLFIIIAVVQSVIIILMMIFQPIYDFFSTIAFLDTRESLRRRYGNARGYGFASSVTYGLGVVQSFSLIFLARMMQIEKKKISHIISYLLILVSILVTGRTGLIGVMLSFIYLLITDSKSEMKGLRRFGGVFIIILLAGLYFSLGVSENTLVSSIQAYVFESVNNFRNTGRFFTTTGLNILKMFGSMKNYPLKTWMIGNGLYKGEGLLYYGNVDVGFLRHILYFGLFGCLFVFMLYAYCYKKGQDRIKEQPIKKMWILIYIYIILAHLKGDFLLGNGMGISLVMVLFFTAVEEGV